jgi:hypothetical protein
MSETTAQKEQPQAETGAGLQEEDELRHGQERHQPPQEPKGRKRLAV